MHSSNPMGEALLQGLSIPSGVGRTILLVVGGFILGYLLLRLWLFFRRGGPSHGI